MEYQFTLSLCLKIKLISIRTGDSNFLNLQWHTQTMVRAAAGQYKLRALVCVANVTPQLKKFISPVLIEITLIFKQNFERVMFYFSFNFDFFKSVCTFSKENNSKIFKCNFENFHPLNIPRDVDTEGLKVNTLYFDKKITSNHLLHVHINMQFHIMFWSVTVFSWNVHKAK